MSDWTERAKRAEGRYRDGEARLPEDPEARQRQLTRMGNAAYAAGLARLMSGDDPSEALDRAAARYRESYADAPPGSWGRLIGTIKARIVAGDWAGAEEAARWTLAEGAADAESPIGRYAATLAALTLGDDQGARVLADSIRTRDDFPADVGDALAMIAAGDVVGYDEQAQAVLESFENRDEYLEDMPVADTVIVLQALAARRDMAAELTSPLLP